jgi:hypothetical protein
MPPCYLKSDNTVQRAVSLDVPRLCPSLLLIKTTSAPGHHTERTGQPDSRILSLGSRLVRMPQ